MSSKNKKKRKFWKRGRKRKKNQPEYIKSGWCQARLHDPDYKNKVT